MSYAAYAQVGSELAGNIMNYFQRKKEYKYEKWLQQHLEQREDTAIQRATSDLRAAGLSPTLAAGAGAQAGPVVKATAPMMDKTDIMTPFLQSQQIKQSQMQERQMKNSMMNQTLQSHAQAQLWATQADQIASLLPFQQTESIARARQALSQSGLSQAMINTHMHNLRIAMDSGLPTNPTGLGGTVRDIMRNMSQTFQNNLNSIQNFQQTQPNTQAPINQGGQSGGW